MPVRPGTRLRLAGRAAGLDALFSAAALAAGAVLLAEGHDTVRTAHACGWANPSGFIAAFADVIGTTPGRYRSGGRSPAAAAETEAPS